MEDKDYTLLREFDYALWRQGARVCDRQGEDIASAATVALLYANGVENILRMQPLAWLQGIPVYPDTDLYHLPSDSVIRACDVPSLDKAINAGVFLAPNKSSPKKVIVEVYFDGERVLSGSLTKSEAEEIKEALDAFNVL